MNTHKAICSNDQFKYLSLPGLEAVQQLNGVSFFRAVLSKADLMGRKPFYWTLVGRT